MNTRPLIDRFIEKIAEPVDAHNDCWVWKGFSRRDRISGENYPVIWTGPKEHRAHRVAYELYVGLIPKGFDIHHMCKNTLCVRPDHLQALSKKDHSGLRRQTHCKNGHLYTEESTYYYPNGDRECVICRRSNQSRRRRQHKEGC